MAVLAGFLEGVRRFSYFRSLPLAFRPMPSKFEASWRKPYGTYSDLRGNLRYGSCRDASNLRKVHAASRLTPVQKTFLDQPTILAAFCNKVPRLVVLAVFRE